MNSYKKAIKQALLPYILCSCALLPVIFFCVTGLVSVGYDIETIIAECWVWGLVILMISLPVGFFVNYAVKLKKIRSICPDIEETAENYDNFAGLHFFTREQFITFEIPAAVKYQDIKRVHRVRYTTYNKYEGNTENYYILIVLDSGKKYKLKKFAEFEFFKGDGYNKKTKENSGQIFRRLKKCCRSADFTELSPAEYRRMNK